MAREIDEEFIEEAVERYRRIDARLAEFATATAGMEVSVRSPDGLVEVVVTAAGTIRDVIIDERLLSESASDVGNSVRLAVISAADAAAWARSKLHAETFADYHLVGGSDGHR